MTDRKTSRRTLIVGGAAAASALTAAQLFGSINLVRAESSRRFKIALVPKSSSDPVFRPALAGGEARAAELGNVDFTFTGPPQSDIAAQVTIVDGLIAAGYDAIGISCCSARGLLDPINRAVAKGIKVVTWDSDSPKSKRSVFYGIDSFKAGQLQAKLLNDLLKGRKGDVWLLSGSPAAQNLQLRIRGVQSILAKDLSLAGLSFCNDDGALGVSQVESVVRGRPNLIGYIMVGAWPLIGGQDALPALRSKATLGLQVVAFDSLEAELPFVANGTVKALVGQDYWGWGYQSVQIMYGLLRGDRYKPFVRQDVAVVTPANVIEYEQRWLNARSGAAMAGTFKEAPIRP